MTDGQLPSVSFVITSYNYERYIDQCVRSALAQERDTGPVTEVVVVDDGSSDGSPAILRAFGERIVLVEQQRQGQGAAINAGVRAAGGDIVLLMDSDDWASPRRAVAVAAAFQADPQAEWMIHNVAVADADGAQAPHPLYDLSRPARLTDDLAAAGDTRGTTSGLAFRRSFLLAMPPVPEAFTIYPDCYLISAAILSGRAIVSDESLTYRRLHDAQASGQRRYDRGRARQLIAMKYELASTVSRMAGSRAGSPPELAGGQAWWQLKAVVGWIKTTDGGTRRDVLVGWQRLIRSAAGHPELSVRRTALLVLRETLLSAMPRRGFERAWWLLHYGRPRFLEKRLRSLAVSVPLAR